MPPVPTTPPASGRRRHLLALLAGPAVLWPPAAHASSPERLAAWTLPGLTGTSTWSPQPGQGPWLYLDFWASWCGPCRLSFPWMNSLHEQWGAQALRIVAVSVDRRREDAQAFLRANPARFEIALDAQGTLARQLEVRTMPTSLLVAPDGRIAHRHEGFTASLADKAGQTIRQLMEKRT